MDNHLYRQNRKLAQWSTGGAYLRFLYEIDPHKLITGVECQFPAIQTEQMALLDTGSELSVAGSAVYQWFFHRNVSLGDTVGQRRLHTRLGTFEGHLYRIEVELTAHWGESSTVESTFLFSAHWTGPTVLGFHDFLERIRFAIDPNYEQVGCIYFAAAD